MKNNKCLHCGSINTEIKRIIKITLELGGDRVISFCKNCNKHFTQHAKNIKF